MDGGLQVYQSLALCVIKNQLFFTGGSYGYDESSEDYYYIHAVRLPVMMSSHCMTWVNQSHILITGGSNYEEDEEDNSEDSAGSYLYSEETGFTRIEDMKRPRSNHGCSVINESLVFVAGGIRNKYTEYLDLATLTWFDGPELPAYVGPATMTRDILVGGGKKI